MRLQLTQYQDERYGWFNFSDFSSETGGMAQKLDRLTTLIDRFDLAVQSAPLAEANLAVFRADAGGPCQLLFLTRSTGISLPVAALGFAARLWFGGASNPLMAALPAQVALELEDGSELGNLAGLLAAELQADRCGAVSVMNRLAEVIVIRLLRHLIEAGDAEPGLIAGLADPQLSRALVALHDAPGRAWSIEDLAEAAGLSRSRFTERFSTTLGVAPGAYLRDWRLSLARQDLEKGHRVQVVAQRYGYGSADGFSRAFRKSFGVIPRALVQTR